MWECLIKKFTAMKSNIGVPFFSDFNADLQIEWQMSRAEKYCFIHLLQHLKPETSIEIGTYMGGSLQVISKFSKQVYSIDISEAPKKFLEDKFSEDPQDGVCFRKTIIKFFTVSSLNLQRLHGQ